MAETRAVEAHPEMPEKIRCPRCRSERVRPSSAVSGHVVCSHCGHTWRLEATQERRHRSRSAVDSVEKKRRADDDSDSGIDLFDTNSTNFDSFDGGGFGGGDSGGGGASGDA